MSSFDSWPLRGLVFFVVPTALLVGLAACSPLGALNALAARDTYRPAFDQAYGPLPRQRVDVYVPTVTPPAAGWPVVVFFYGGSWTRGERADYRFVGEALAARGLLVAIPDYRLAPEAPYPVFLEDSAGATGWRSTARRRSAAIRSASS